MPSFKMSDGCVLQLVTDLHISITLQKLNFGHVFKNFFGVS